jgi:hypothetical protein
LLVEFGDGVIARQGDVGCGREGGQGGEHFGFVRGDGGGDEGLGCRLFEAEWIAFTGLVAFVVVDGDFEGLREAVVGGVTGGEFEAFGGTADGARGVDDLKGVLVVEVFYWPVAAGTTTSGARKLASVAERSCDRPRA